MSHFRQHNTSEEKEERRKAYKKLRDAGFSRAVSVLLRDWTDAKIELVCQGIAKPSILYKGVQNVAQS
jgi:RNA:NAD 2'-phosphotransferase (TPT1/KptA family)